MATRTYQKGDLLVHWDSSRCIHVAACLRAAPQVFDVRRRPWVLLDAASEEEIVAAVEKCPTGALRYERGGVPEKAPAQTTLTAMPNGPLLVRGEVRVVDKKGNVLAAGPRLALCRCGKSQNQPFCDNAHRRSRFTEEQRAEKPEATAPADVCPPQGF